jgi:molybdopterin synthase catalytic subunit
MRRHIEITPDPIAKALARLDGSWAPEAAGGSDPAESSQVGRVAGSAGACLDFYGIVRELEVTQAHPEGMAIAALDYEAHEGMAARQCELICERLAAAYPLDAMLVIHRTGRVPVGEASLLVRIFSPHRGEALKACAEFLDQLKTWVPIWKHPVPRLPRPS